MKNGEFDLRNHFRKQAERINRSKEKSLKELDELLFTKQTIKIDDKPFRVPRCQICKQPMSPAIDSMNGKLTGYLWKCDCPIGKKYTLGIG